MKHVSREASRLRRAQRELEYRRINWRACAQQQIRRAFQGLVATARAEQYPIKLTLGEYDEPNEEAVLIEARPHPTGVVNRKTKFNFETLEREHDDTAVQETGGGLIARQTVDGFISFIAFPRTSDRILATPPEVFLFARVEPREVTSRFLEKVAKRYLLILRRSSHLGGPRALSLLDSVAFLWIRLCDIRTKNRVVRGLLALENKWLSFFLGAAAAVLVDRFFKK